MAESGDEPAQFFVVDERLLESHKQIVGHALEGALQAADAHERQLQRLAYLIERQAGADQPQRSDIPDVEVPGGHRLACASHHYTAGGAEPWGARPGTDARCFAPGLVFFAIWQ